MPLARTTTMVRSIVQVCSTTTSSDDSLGCTYVRTSAMAYYLGIDGGGTKTRCLLADETNVLAKEMATSGGSNIVRLGEQPARQALRAAMRQACASAKINPNRIRAVCIGAAGAARPEITAKIRSILRELVPEIPAEKIEVVGDSVIALEAAFGAGPGVIAIAGTGSIVYGRNANGDTARAGGWGFAISDEGSGHWIGRRAIAAVMSAYDERQGTALTNLILQAWKLNSLDELVQQANATPAPDFPRLLHIVLRAADGGDAVASDLLSDAGAKLAALAATVVHRLVASADAVPFPLAMTGSVFRQSPQVRGVFYNALQRSFPGLEVRPNLVEPVEGALARARRL
jgi:N-acetylglucosamine kinase-like BadF-type ATPase